MSIATLSAATGGRADDIHRHARTAAAAEVERTTTFGVLWILQVSPDCSQNKDFFFLTIF